MNAAGSFHILSLSSLLKGFTFLWTGKFAAKQLLAKANACWIRGSGAKRLVTTCAECYSMLKYEYPKVVGPWDGLEVLHMSELIGQLVGGGEGEVARPVAVQVTHQ